MTRRLGRNRLVRPNQRLPWARELRSILMQTVGVVGRLGNALSGIEGVHEAFVFGSWAARLEGEPGPFPNDVDVVVIGTVSLRVIRRACRKLEQDLRVDINPVVVDRESWDSDAPGPFIAQIKQQPLVPIPQEAAHGV